MRLLEATIFLTAVVLGTLALGLQEQEPDQEVIFDPEAGPEGVDYENGETGEFRAPSEGEMETFAAKDAVHVEEVKFVKISRGLSLDYSKSCK